MCVFLFIFSSFTQVSCLSHFTLLLALSLFILTWKSHLFFFSNRFSKSRSSSPTTLPNKPKTYFTHFDLNNEIIMTIAHSFTQPANQSNTYNLKVK